MNLTLERQGPRPCDRGARGASLASGARVRGLRLPLRLGARGPRGRGPPTPRPTRARASRLEVDEEGGRGRPSANHGPHSALPAHGRRRGAGRGPLGAGPFREGAGRRALRLAEPGDPATVGNRARDAGADGREIRVSTLLLRRGVPLVPHDGDWATSRLPSSPAFGC